MLIKYFQKAINFLKGFQEITLFATMADSRVYMSVGASPFFYMMLPFLGVLLNLNALINGYHLAKSSNKNFDLWLNFLSSGISSVLAGVALYGSLISLVLSSSFVMAPWFFLSSLAVGIAHQFIMFGLNLYRACESSPKSAQRMHYVQATLRNLFGLGLLLAAASAITLIVLFSPVLPLMGMVSSAIAIGLTLVDIMWRIFPHNLKIKIKGLFKLGKPDTSDIVVEHSVDSIEQNIPRIQNENPSHHRLFTSCDYSVHMRSLDKASAKIFLLKLIDDKLSSYSNISMNDKILDKIALLKQLYKKVDKECPSSIAKKDVLKDHPHAFQSFWTEKGAIEQLFDAVAVFQTSFSDTSTCSSTFQNN